MCEVFLFRGYLFDTGSFLGCINKTNDDFDNDYRKLCKYIYEIIGGSQYIYCLSSESDECRDIDLSNIYIRGRCVNPTNDVLKKDEVLSLYDTNDDENLSSEKNRIANKFSLYFDRDPNESNFFEDLDVYTIGYNMDSSGEITLQTLCSEQE